MSVFSPTGCLLIQFFLQFQLQYYGPFFFIDEPYCCFTGSKKSSSTGIIIGVAVGCSVLVLLVIFAGIYAFLQRKRAKSASERSNPFSSWDPKKGSGSVPQLQEQNGFPLKISRNALTIFQNPSALDLEATESTCGVTNGKEKDAPLLCNIN
ncbi:unnamed protein product [Fraxinus pennsylvanica]|uniref:Uncharacterized protein n=1 Tax=Fraxinus pennsylvanica TaxID=56036 RepID=A0AAD2DPZ6_9LAMI|nr:unnamed protein product [Fraxinus pennsylvanica]